MILIGKLLSQKGNSRCGSVLGKAQTHVDPGSAKLESINIPV